MSNICNVDLDPIIELMQYVSESNPKGFQPSTNVQGILIFYIFIELPLQHDFVLENSYITNHAEIYFRNSKIPISSYILKHHLLGF